MELENKPIDFLAAVKGLHGLGSHELSRLLKLSDIIPLPQNSVSGSAEIDSVKLARFLPLHLIAVTLTSQRDEASLKYLLCGLRLLHCLCEIASQHPKLEQVLLDDVEVLEQLLDLVFYVTIVTSSYRQEQHAAHPIPLLLSTLVACSIYLLTTCISTNWSELGSVLLGHPKVDLFMDVLFKAVCRSFNFLQIRLSAEQNKIRSEANAVAGQTLHYLCQQCEASLQFIQSLCQQRSFRERLLRHKELCARGGILQVAQVAMALKVSSLSGETHAVAVAVSRMKSRVLSILLHLCEADNVSFLDEVANDSRSLEIAKFLALEILELLKTMLTRDATWFVSPGGKTYPTNSLQLNALRLADIFSDDSNFRSFITTYVTELLGTIFSLPYQEFVCNWCSSDLPWKEEDAVLDYDPFKAAGWVVDSCSSSEFMNAGNIDSTILRRNLPQASYAHQRTSLLVKVIANLHCFVPKICEEKERNHFFYKLVENLHIGLPLSSEDLQKAAAVSKNFGSLVSHAESLVPAFLNGEDIQLLRLFFNQLQSEVGPAESEANEGLVNEAKSERACGSFQPGFLDPKHKFRNGNLKEGGSENLNIQGNRNTFVQEGATDEADTMTTLDQRVHKDISAERVPVCAEEDEKDAMNVDTSGSDSSSTRGKYSVAPLGKRENSKSSSLAKKEFRGAQGDENIETVFSEERKPRKRKRNIMNDKQISMMESALLEEPEMQKNAASIQSWAERLSLHGAEVTSSQLKNWVNNRKAKLARAAAKDSSRPWENSFTETQDAHGGPPSSDTPESAPEDPRVSSAADGKAENTPVGDDSMKSNAVQGTSSPPAERSSLSNIGNDCSSSKWDFSSLLNMGSSCSTSKCNWEPGQMVMLLDEQGMEKAKAKVNQVKGKWNGISLEEASCCVVDIIEFKAEIEMAKLRFSQATGAISKGESKIRVLWQHSKMLPLRPH